MYKDPQEAAKVSAMLRAFAWIMVGQLGTAYMIEVFEGAQIEEGRA